MTGVVQDHVERAAVRGDARDRLTDLRLRREQQRRGVEVAAAGLRGPRDPVDARHDRPGLPEDAVEQEHDHRHDDEQEHQVEDPPEGHDGLRSATIAALAPMPGSAERITSNWALIACTAGSSGRRCSDSTPSSAPASAARPSEAFFRPRRTSISAAASTATTTTASRMERATIYLPP